MKTDEMSIPATLSEETAKWYREVVESFVLESHHIRLLTIAAEAWDRRLEAHRLLQAEGLVFKDQRGVIKPHPAAAIEKEASILFIRAIRELNLDTEPASEAARPPQLRQLRRG